MEPPKRETPARTTRHYAFVCACPPIGKDHLPHVTTVGCVLVRLKVIEVGLNGAPVDDSV